MVNILLTEISAQILNFMKKDNLDDLASSKSSSLYIFLFGDSIYFVILVIFFLYFWKEYLSRYKLIR
jgi:hypothetical protein